MPWVNLDKALEWVDIDEMSLEAIRAFLDLVEGGEKRVELYNDLILTEYFGEYSLTAKSFRVTSGMSGAFKEYTSFYVLWMLLQQSLYAVSKAHGSIIIAGWENRALDWAGPSSCWKP
jgi:hypothetical protein